MRRPGTGRRTDPRRLFRAGAAVAPPQTLFGANGFLNTAYYTTSGGEAGSASGFGWFALWSPAATTTASGSLLSRFVAGSGYALRIVAGTIQGFAYNGSAALTQANSDAIVAGDVGKVQLTVVQHSGAGNTIQMYNRRLAIGAPAAISGYTAGIPSTRLGNRFDANDWLLNATLYGGGAWLGVPSLAQIQAFYDAVKAGATIPNSITGATMTHTWKFPDGTAPASLSDSPGADSMTRVGAPVGVTTTPVTWGW